MIHKPTSRSVWVKFQKEGIHKYPAALTDPRLESVSFLGNPHRHIFHFYVEIEVFHDDRDIEFIMFKRELESLYVSGVMDIDHKSCEMLSDDLAEYILEKYPNRQLSISVSEDDENGSLTTYHNV